MVSEQLHLRGIRTTNLEIDLHKKLMLIKVEKDYKSLSSLIETLFNFYEKRNKKLVGEVNK